MLRTARVLLLLAVPLTVAAKGYGQEAAPLPGLSPTEANWGLVGPGVSPPPSVMPPQGTQPWETSNGPLLKGDPLLDGPACAPPGWLAGVELDPVGPHLKNQLTGSVPTPAGAAQVQLPTADLGWTVSPRIDAGYRFSQGFGEVLASYRFVEATGAGTVAPFAPDGSAGALRSRLDLNVFDLDYGSREFSLGPGWDMKWFAGVRLASLFFDCQAVSDVLAQHEGNHFFGAGPHTGLELWHTFDDSGLALFGRLDGGIVFGSIHQDFEQTTAAADGGLSTGSSQPQADQQVTVLAVQVGLGWAPPEAPYLRFAGGYTFERWWNIGEVGAVGTSAAQLTVQGIFLRGEWRF
jgi:hypothetical protein